MTVDSREMGYCTLTCERIHWPQAVGDEGCWYERWDQAAGAGRELAWEVRARSCCLLAVLALNTLYLQRGGWEYLEGGVGNALLDRGVASSCDSNAFCVGMGMPDNLLLFSTNETARAWGARGQESP